MQKKIRRLTRWVQSFRKKPDVVRKKTMKSPRIPYKYRTTHLYWINLVKIGAYSVVMSCRKISVKMCFFNCFCHGNFPFFVLIINNWILDILKKQIESNENTRNFTLERNFGEKNVIIFYFPQSRTMTSSKRFTDNLNPIMFPNIR